MMIDVKICPNCKSRNSVNAPECTECGCDLTFVYPQTIDDAVSECSDAETKSESTIDGEWTVVSISNNSYQETIREEVSVGRDCPLFNDLLNGSNFTSRIHAKIRPIDNKLQIMDASTNGTFINDTRIPKMEWVDVTEGDTIRFADVSFTVRRK